MLLESLLKEHFTLWSAVFVFFWGGVFSVSEGGMLVDHNKQHYVEIKFFIFLLFYLMFYFHSPTTLPNSSLFGLDIIQLWT